MGMSKASVLSALIVIVLLHALVVSAGSGRHRKGAPRHPAPRHPAPRHPLQGRGKPAQPRLVFPPRLSFEDQEYLKAHNTFRAKRGVRPLQWDAKLAQYARNWAVQRSYDCVANHHSNGPYGENIMWQQYEEMTPTDIVNTWAYEQDNFDHIKNVCKCRTETKGCMCGHYMQLVWSSAKRVGCATVMCKQEKGFYTVCEYDRKKSSHINPLKGVIA
ncbi:hypothetical protein RJ639_017807 [Escallonia herrerae]|uniref:SCP domain-containing protein n=1 Tax=Escallonia herrerae TaxID=1293975 RepID=A0AA88VI44_9ASTE|nr:hypothetical protein RJ639_017807 [Escallonia herrerae]